jgi:carbon monoxide dehydrogenase subunit G
MAPPPITASRPVAVPPEAVFAYLDDLANHASLAPRSARVLSLERRPERLDRAVVSLKGPLGMRRTASTELVRTEPPGLIAGRAQLGRSTSASVTWTIEGAPSGSVVSLSAAIQSAGPLDALVLRLGGRRWIARRFALALNQLAERLESPAAAPHARFDPATGALLSPDQA